MHMRQKLSLTFVIVFAILLVAIAFTFYGVKSRVSQKTKAVLATTLQLVPASSSVGIGATFPIHVTLTTQHQVVIADLGMYYDKTKVDLLTVVPGPFFPGASELAKTLDKQTSNTTTGLLYYSVHVSTDLLPQTGTGTIAVVTFRAKAAGTAVFTWQSPLTVVGAIGSDISVLTDTTNTQVSIAVPSATPTKTNTPTRTPTATPTRTPTRTPTPTVPSGPTRTSTRTQTPNPNFSPTPTQPAQAWPGDINRDGKVNALDYVILFENFTPKPLVDTRADLNADGSVNALDYVVLFENFGRASV